MKKFKRNYRRPRYHKRKRGGKGLKKYISRICKAKINKNKETYRIDTQVISLYPNVAVNFNATDGRTYFANTYNFDCFDVADGNNYYQRDYINAAISTFVGAQNCIGGNLAFAPILQGNQIQRRAMVIRGTVDLTLGSIQAGGVINDQPGNTWFANQVGLVPYLYNPQVIVGGAPLSGATNDSGNDIHCGLYIVKGTRNQPDQYVLNYIMANVANSSMLDNGINGFVNPNFIKIYQKKIFKLRGNHSSIKFNMKVKKSVARQILKLSNNGAGVFNRQLSQGNLFLVFVSQVIQDPSPLPDFVWYGQLNCNVRVLYKDI